MSQRRFIRLGAVPKGTGGPGDHGVWKDESVPGDASISLDYYTHQAKLAEHAKFDLLFIVDSHFITPDSPPHYLNRLEPFTLLSALAARTSRIGLVGTITTSFEDPFLVARRFASLDLISGGRAGWNVVTSGDEGTARLFGRAEHYDYDSRYGRALEHVRLVQQLWDSYEDDAFPADRDAGVFLDQSKLHAVEHRGTHFDLEGALNVSRSAQGQPVIFQAGDSDLGRDLGAAVGEGIFTHQSNAEAGRAFREDLRARAERFGRNPDHVLIMPGVEVVVGDTDEDARQREAANHRQDADFEKTLKQFGRSFGWHDFTQYDLDAPFPDLDDLGDRSFKTRSDNIRAVARSEGLTLRQVVDRFTAPKQSPFTGSAETVADTIQEWYETGALDGLNVHYRTHEQFTRFTDEVLPLLRERGVARTEYDGSTLRQNLGLPYIPNRHTAPSLVEQGA
ncbi:NtaA/DmoA family FMN-dependent monooxygenase [Microbacterium sp. A93]|uniref:NtaA/DmoA family FMN-dependent monooxygenase n=1 Tax=Microbacterium sp. A93 TaxID=3450716 RepID=UPI003F43775E